MVALPITPPWNHCSEYQSEVATPLGSCGGTDRIVLVIYPAFPVLAGATFRNQSGLNAELERAIQTSFWLRCISWILFSFGFHLGDPRHP